MKRIKQLLAKGIENLDEAEKAELLSLLAPEQIAEIPELAEVKEAVKAAADAMLEDPDDSDVTIEALNTLADILDVVTAEEERRAVEAEEAAARKQALRDRIKGVEATDEGSDDPTDEDAVTPDENPSDETSEPEPVVVEVPVPVTAGASSAPVRSRVAAPRPSDRSPRPRGNPRQAAITAAANVPGVSPGMKLDDDEKLFRAIDAGVRIGMSTESDYAFKLPLITLRSEIPDDLQLHLHDQERNEQIIERRSGVEAIVAAGGACAPVPYRYDLPTVGDDMQPVRDQSLTRYGAQRGGASFFIPPTITDVSSQSGATTQAVSEWTYDTDVTPAGATKPYLRIDCGNNTPQVTRLNAIVTQYESGNMMERWYPELIQAYVKLIGVWAARYSEAKRLAKIATLSKVVTHGQVLGSASDIFPALDQLLVGIRYRHRIMQNVTLHVTGFDWVRTSIITDLIRRGDGDRPLEERLAMAQSVIDGWFRARNCNVTWSPDFQFGVAFGSPGGPVAGVQGIGPVIGLPSVARFYVWIEGSMLYLDGGEFRLGVMRDVVHARTNDWVFFAETFENIAYHGVPGEAYVYDMDICANGAYSSAIDIAPCVTNS